MLTGPFISRADLVQLLGGPASHNDRGERVCKTRGFMDEVLAGAGGSMCPLIADRHVETY